MASPPGSNAFFDSVAGYENFMGRYAHPLAQAFVEWVPAASGSSVLDVGCGPGALTRELVRIVGAESVTVIDPSPPFLEYTSATYPGVKAVVAQAEHIPFDDHAFDTVLAQLVIHFIGDLQQAGREFLRVTKPGGKVAVSTWNVERMEKINLLPRSAHAASIEVPPLRVLEFNEAGSVANFLKSVELVDVEESTITVSSTYADFEELWNSYMAPVGPMGPWIVAQPEETKSAIKQAMNRILGEPSGELSLSGEARVARGRAPA